VTSKKTSERGIATLEYGITVGVVALIAAAMFAQTSAGVTGVWKQATVAASKNAPQNTSSPQFLDCMAKAHGDSKICSSVSF
jgi:Flp pilus assembly pilin Flp